jgi:hypothetical protein
MSTTNISPRATPYVELTPVENNAPADGSSTNSVKARIIGANGQAMVDQNYPVTLEVTSGAAVFRDTGDQNVTAFIDPANNGYTAPIALTDRVSESVVVRGSVFFPPGVQPNFQGLNFSTATTYQIIFDPVPNNGLTLSPNALQLRARVLKDGQPYNGKVRLTITDDMYHTDRDHTILNLSDPIFFSETNQKYIDVPTINGYASASVYSRDGSGPIAAIRAQAEGATTVAYQIVAFATQAGLNYSIRAAGPTSPTPADGTSQCVVTATAFQGSNPVATSSDAMIYFFGLLSDQVSIKWAKIPDPQCTSKITATDSKAELAQVMFQFYDLHSSITAWLPYVLIFS